MTTRLIRLIIFCGDVNRLIEFYQTNFKLTLTEEPSDNWAVLNAGHIEIAFHRIGQEYRTSDPTDFVAETNTKFVFEIDEDITTFRDTLKANGVDIGETKTFPGINYIFCEGKDPEGNVFQISKPI
jgi:predicted enzyme related to lactoylglutathione lyase